MDPGGEEEKEESAGCESKGELRVDVGSVMCFRNLNGILVISIHDGDYWGYCQAHPGIFKKQKQI